MNTVKIVACTSLASLVALYQHVTSTPNISQYTLSVRHESTLKHYFYIEVYSSLGTNTEIYGAKHTIYSYTTNVMIYKIPQKRSLIVLNFLALRYDTSVPLI